MDFKKFFNNITNVNNSKSTYNFSILSNVNSEPEEITEVPPISNKIKNNLDFIKFKYNTLINNDIIIREFKMPLNNGLDCFLVYVDGMINSISVNDFILEPLMYAKESDFTNSNLNLANYLCSYLVPQSSMRKISSYEDVFNGINMGDCVLFIDSLNIAFDIDVKSYNQRNVSTPETETIIKGPHEAFVENIRTNTALLRRIINNENLVIENIPVGKISKTKCGVCYMQNIANNDLVAEVKFRLNNINIDSLLSSGQLEQLIEIDDIFGIPQTISTERPDKCTKYLLQGRVVVLINGNPYALILPATIEDFLFSPEDTNLRPIFANFLRVIRIASALITLLLPGIYIAITSFHQELLPTELLFSILISRESVPFPVIFELMLMEFSFELIREAGLRVPSPIGSTIGIVGALILGDAAVKASIVSPILIIIVAITGIASFSIPDFSFGFHIRVFRFLFIGLGYIAGFLGIGTGFFIYICIMCSLKSFGVPYTVPFAPASHSRGNGYFIPPIWKQEYRANFISPKKEKAQDKISMKWRY